MSWKRIHRKPKPKRIRYKNKAKPTAFFTEETRYPVVLEPQLPGPLLAEVTLALLIGAYLWRLTK